MGDEEEHQVEQPAPVQAPVIKMAQAVSITDLKKRLDRASVVQKMKPAEMRGGHIGRSQFAARRCKAL